MAETVLEWTLIAVDKASDKFKDVGRAVDDTGGKMSGFAGIAGAAVGVFAAMQVGGFVGGLIQAGEEGQRVDATLRSVTTSMNLFGGQTDHVVDRMKNFATEMMKKTGIDDDVIKSTQAQLMTFKDLAASADEAGGMFDRATMISAGMAAVFGGDASSNAVKLGKALNDPVDGISALSRVGVQFTDDQKAMIQTMVEAGDVAGAQGLIMKELETEVGDAATTSATSADKMKAGWDDAMQGIGTAILPVFEEVVAFLQDNVLPAVNSFSDWAQKNPEVLTALAIGLGTVAVAFLAVSVAMWAASMTPISLIVGAIVLAVGLLIAGLFLLVQNWDSVMKFLGDAWAGFVGWISDGLDAFGSFFSDVWEGIGQVVNDVWNGIMSFIKDGINSAIGLINGLIDGFNAVAGLGKVIGIDFQLSKIPMLATGGEVLGGGAAIVGERGPELVSLPAGATVYSNAQTMRGLSGSGGGGMNVTVNVSAGAVADKDGLSRAITTAIIDGVKRGVVSQSELKRGLGIA